MIIWSVADIKNALSASSLLCGEMPALEEGCGQVFTDSRTRVANGLFVPLRGEVYDGHDFVKAAFEHGAVASLWDISLPVPEELSHLPLIKVKDTLLAYQSLAAYQVSRLEIPVIGVTGSVGKTTSKDLLLGLLSTRFKVHCTPLNHNNEVGVPKTLLELNSEHQLAVIEMGMRGFGQIRALAQICRPQVGLITTIGESHLELLGTRENIAKAKAELLDVGGRNMLSVLPFDSPYYGILREHAQGQVFSFSADGHKEADFYLLKAEPVLTGAFGGFKVKYAAPDGEHNLITPLPGLHNISNLLGALAVCHHFGLKPEDLRSALLDVRLTGMRLSVEILPCGVMLIDDSYNAAPSSVKAALNTVAGWPNRVGRLCAVVGDMLELGEQTDAMHQEIGAELGRLGFDFVVAVGEFSRHTAVSARAGGVPEVHWVKDREEAWNLLPVLLKAGDRLLVKASHSIGLDAICRLLRENGIR